MNDIYSHDEGRLEIRLPLGGRMEPFVLCDVAVAFYDGGRAAHQEVGVGCLLNKLVSAFCGQMTHVELAFRFENKELGKESWFSCGIYQGHRLQFRSKSYDTVWKVIDLKLQGVEIERLFKACRSDVELDLQFDGWFFVNFLSPACSLRTQPVAHSRKTWCSEHVASRLALLDFDFGYSAGRVTPTRIYEVLLDKGYVPFQRSRTMNV